MKTTLGLLRSTGAIATVILAPTLLSSRPAEAAFTDGPKAILDEAWQIVYREYVDDSFNRTDWVEVRQELLGQNYTSRQAAYTELRRALRQLDDPYTRFLSPDQYAELTDQTSGEISGIGLRLRRDRDAGTVVVSEVIEGSPADTAGILVGDHILIVNGRSTEFLSAEGTAQLLHGETDTQVTLTIEREGQSETVIVSRTRLEIQIVSAKLEVLDDINIGYIRLDEFNAHAAEQMQAAIAELSEQGAEAFVLDLRNNPGGLLQASIDISRMWLRRGPIVRTVNRSGDSEQISANRTHLTELPMAILVNGESASSSEIVTGALGDNDRAVVVGSPTFGKALVQSLHGLSDGSGIAVTVAHYYTPNGTDISSKGITPDIQVSLSSDQRRTLSTNPELMGTTNDPQFIEAVSALETEVTAARRRQGLSTVSSPIAPTPQLVRTLER
ncbi:c-terminal processing peptidase-2 [Leptolyngbya sp. Heron Island J]|uniref:S41 family peptidase n=1 Tax=Leptolyngbya sp. Heron Island J TaxID=1385935 RepID=UPI0003B9E975|nr:S41 family peptidase [Leptolyngbya sp. Heron Island J]ESA33201.1 c-terminal processing peptidase-2 [Leptolyngbya sp. Heron Island J]